jgi:hypothetical protein
MAFEQHSVVESQLIPRADIRQSVEADTVISVYLRRGVRKLGRDEGGKEKEVTGRMRREMRGQDRTEQDRTGQDRVGQYRTGQDRTGQDRTGQDRTGQDRTGQDTTRQ